MFKRIELDAWLQMMPQIAFWIFFCVFIVVVIRILRTPRSEVHYLEELPLEQERLRDEK